MVMILQRQYGGGGPFFNFFYFLENVIIGREILKIEETIEKSWGKL